MLSPAMKSVLFTKGVTSKYDDRQKVGQLYTMPDFRTRKLCAELILEEAKETIEALGFSIGGSISIEREVGKALPELTLFSQCHPNIVKAIDGCCDTIYVCLGAMAAMGVPDIPHLGVVCNANDAKFPNGVAIINAETGKYLKPEGWQPPDHQSIIDNWQMDERSKNFMIDTAESLVENGDSSPPTRQAQKEEVK